MYNGQMETPTNLEKICGIVAGRLMPPNIALLVFESDKEGKLTGRKFMVECSDAKFFDLEGNRLKLKRNDDQLIGYLFRKHNTTDVHLNEYIEVEGFLIPNLTVLGKDYKSFPATKIILSRKIVGKIKANDEKVINCRGGFSVGKDGKTHDVVGDIHGVVLIKTDH